MRRAWTLSAYLGTVGMIAAFSIQLADVLTTEASEKLKILSDAARPPSRVERHVQLQLQAAEFNASPRAEVAALTPPPLHVAVLAAALDRVETADTAEAPVGTHAVRISAHGRITRRDAARPRDRAAPSASRHNAKSAKASAKVLAAALMKPSALKKVAAVAKATSATKKAPNGKAMKTASVTTGGLKSSAKAIERAVFAADRSGSPKSRRLQIAETPGMLMYARFVGERI